MQLEGRGTTGNHPTLAPVLYKSLGYSFNLLIFTPPPLITQVLTAPITGRTAIQVLAIPSTVYTTSPFASSVQQALYLHVPSVRTLNIQHVFLFRPKEIKTPSETCQELKTQEKQEKQKTETRARRFVILGVPVCSPPLLIAAFGLIFPIL